MRLTSSEAGFSLVELLVTVAIVAILSAIAAPSYQSLIAANKLSHSANQLLGGANLARMEAIRRGQPMRLCASSSGEACDGQTWERWLVRSSKGEILLEGQTKAGVTAEPSDRLSEIIFNGSGLARLPDGRIASGQISMCVQGSDRALKLRMFGGSRLRLESHDASECGES
jgi:type IV fimbrial biogenesis protein FimT